MVEWLERIAHAEVVVTNSFHGVAMSLILNIPFIAVLMKGSGMNDRIRTLLAGVGLEDRAVDGFDQTKIDGILSINVNWEEVNERIESLREVGQQFLQNALSE